MRSILESPEEALYSARARFYNTAWHILLYKHGVKQVFPMHYDELETFIMELTELERVYYGVSVWRSDET